MDFTRQDSLSGVVPSLDRTHAAAVPAPAARIATAHDDAPWDSSSVVGDVGGLSCIIQM